MSAPVPLNDIDRASGILNELNLDMGSMLMLRKQHALLTKEAGAIAKRLTVMRMTTKDAQLHAALEKAEREVTAYAEALAAAEVMF